MRHYLTLLFLFTTLVVVAQESYYFPERNEVWEEKAPKELQVNAKALQKAIEFAEENEYSGSRDLRIAILNGFKREPFHEILGPTKKRGGPARNGVILNE